MREPAAGQYCYLCIKGVGQKFGYIHEITRSLSVVVSYAATDMRGTQWCGPRTVYFVDISRSEWPNPSQIDAVVSKIGRPQRYAKAKVQ